MTETARGGHSKNFVLTHRTLGRHRAHVHCDLPQEATSDWMTAWCPACGRLRTAILAGLPPRRQALRCTSYRAQAPWPASSTSFDAEQDSRVAGPLSMQASFGSSAGKGCALRSAPAANTTACHPRSGIEPPHKQPTNRWRLPHHHRLSLAYLEYHSCPQWPPPECELSLEKASRTHGAWKLPSGSGAGYSR